MFRKTNPVSQSWLRVCILLHMSFPKQRLSIAMVMDELKDQCNVVTTAKAQVSAAVEERNQMMVELKSAGIPELTLVKLTGLSRDSVAKITAGARRGKLALEIADRLR